MAFNAGTRQESEPVKLFTGLADFRPVLINPTKDQLSRIGVNYADETNYTSADSETGVKKLRIDIWGEVTGKAKGDVDVAFFHKMTFFLDNSEKLSSTGKYEYINEFGDSAWVEEGVDPSTIYNWFTKSYDTRKAKNGEALFVSFMKKWLSVGKGELAKIENISKFIEGDIKELQGLFTPTSTRKLQVLLTLREYEGNYYQTIYSRYFGNPGSTNVKWWTKHLDGQNTPPMYNNSFLLSEFNPLSIGTTDDKTPSSNSVWEE